MISKEIVNIIDYPEYKVDFELVDEKNYIHMEVYTWNKQVYKELKILMDMYVKQSAGHPLYAALTNEKVIKFAEKFGFKPTGVELELRLRSNQAQESAQEYVKET